MARKNPSTGLTCGEPQK